MRVTMMLGLAVVFAGCSKAETPPAADTSTGMTEAPAAISLGAVAGVWDVRVMPEGRDTVLASYVLNTMDSTAWTFTFPNRPALPMRITGMAGDSILTEAGPFESAVRKGMQVRTSGASWMQDGKLMGRVTARYETAAADSVASLRTEGTRQ